MSREDLRVANLRSAIKGPFTADFAAAACTAITGPSGVGKSLFLRMIADLDPNEGTVQLGDLGRDTMPAPEWRRLVTYVPAEPGWWAETLVEHMSNIGEAKRIMPEFGLDPALLDHPTLQLSTGERQRAALVRAVVKRPRFLLLDEPTSALDPAARARVEDALVRLVGEGLGLVLVTHDVEQTSRVAGHRMTMSAAGLGTVS